MEWGRRAHAYPCITVRKNLLNSNYLFCLLANVWFSRLSAVKTREERSPKALILRTLLIALCGRWWSRQVLRYIFTRSMRANTLMVSSIVSIFVFQMLPFEKCGKAATSKEVTSPPMSGSSVTGTPKSTSTTPKQTRYLCILYIFYLR